MKKILSFVLLSLTISFGYAQKLGGATDLINKNIPDGVKLVNAYITPFNRAMMVGMNNSEFVRLRYDDDAMKHFSFSIRTSIIVIPEADKTFDVDKIGLENFHAADPNNSIAQTVFGDSTSRILVVSNDSVIVLEDNDSPIGGGGGDDGGSGGFPFKRLLGLSPVDTVPAISFNTPPGSGYGIMPLPYLNFNYHLKYAAASVSGIPWIKLPNSDVNMSLISMMWHQDIAMFLPFLRKSPLAVSVTGGLYHFYAHTQLNLQPDATVTVKVTDEETGPYDNQEIKINYNSVFVSSYASYNISHFSIYAGIGYNSGTSHIQVLGNYPVYFREDKTGAVVQDKDVIDPMDTEDAYSRIRYTGGVQYDLGGFYTQLNYSYGNYGGVGFVVGYRFL